MKYGFKAKDFLYGAAITAIIALITGALALLGLSTRVFDPIGQAISNFHLSDSFFYSRSLHAGEQKEANPGVVLVNIADCDSREEIADIVNRINSASPKLLAVDVIFARYASASAAGDSALVAALSEAGKLILAQRWTRSAEEWTVERSFFADVIPCIEGDVNFTYGVVREFSDSFAAGNRVVPSFIGQIACEAGLKEGFGKQLINYNPVYTVMLTPEQLSDTSLLEDQIVILGDAGDLRDFHDIPVLMDGMPRASGMKIFAQCLYSLQPGNGFRECPSWLALLAGILLTYLFCTFFASPLFRVNRFNGFWISVWQLLVMLLLVSLNYLLFWSMHFIMPLTWWLVGVGLAGLATEFFYFCMRNEN